MLALGQTVAGVNVRLFSSRLLKISSVTTVLRLDRAKLGHWLRFIPLQTDSNANDRVPIPDLKIGPSISPQRVGEWDAIFFCLGRCPVSLVIPVAVLRTREITKNKAWIRSQLLSPGDSHVLSFFSRRKFQFLSP